MDENSLPLVTASCPAKKIDVAFEQSFGSEGREYIYENLEAPAM